MNKQFSVENQSFEIISGLESDSIKEIERVARVCTKTERLIKKGSADKLVDKLLTKEHMSPIEFGRDITVKFNIDRGLSHQLVRHRLCSFQQKSQRYVNDGKDLVFIRPMLCSETVLGDWSILDRPIQMGDYPWLHHCFEVARTYKKLTKNKWSPEFARSILPNCTKTELFLKGNIRNWLHIFDLRCSDHSHPQLSCLMRDLLKEFYRAMPVIFDNLYYRYCI